MRSPFSCPGIVAEQMGEKEQTAAHDTGDLLGGTPNDSEETAGVAERRS
jgi:hypothetical protein